MSLKLRVIVDAAGRTILGEHESETKTELRLKNPATLFIQPNQQTGQLAVQLIPFFFREFVEEKLRPEGLTWTFDKTTIALTPEFGLDARLQDQYEKMMTKEANIDPPALPEPASSQPVEDAPVEKQIDLFAEQAAAAHPGKKVKMFDDAG